MASKVTVSARQAAVLISGRLGRDVTPKQVRTVARDLLPAYQDDAYTQHAYDKADVLALLAAFGQRATRRGASIAGSGPDGKVTAADVESVLGIDDAIAAVAERRDLATGRGQTAPDAAPAADAPETAQAAPSDPKGKVTA